MLPSAEIQIIFWKYIFLQPTIQTIFFAVKTNIYIYTAGWMQYSVVQKIIQCSYTRMLW